MNGWSEKLAIFGGSGFAFGLFSAFGIDHLLLSFHYAFALTIMGFTCCIVLATGAIGYPMDKFRKTMIGLLALFSLIVAAAGVWIFFWDYNVHPDLEAEATFSTDLKHEGHGELSLAPRLLATHLANPTNLTLSQTQIDVYRGDVLTLDIVGLPSLLAKYDDDWRVRNRMQKDNDALQARVDTEAGSLEKCQVQGQDDLANFITRLHLKLCPATNH